MKGALLRYGCETEIVKVRLDLEDMVDLDRESRRQGRPRAWLMRQAWRIAREQIRRFPDSTPEARRR